MNKFSQLSFALTVCLAGHGAIAQPATYQDFEFTIPHGAALLDGEASYYSDIQMQSTIEGNFAVVAAEKNSLVTVKSVVVNIAESLPVQVSLVVSGEKSVPCVELLAPAIFRGDASFTVALAESNLGPAESCIAVIDPFETTIPLDTTGLAGGTYTVRVNGVETSFEL